MAIARTVVVVVEADLGGFCPVCLGRPPAVATVRAPMAAGP